MESIGAILLPRLGRALLTIWIIMTFTFVLLRLTGDPADAMLPDDASVEQIEALNRALGLQSPIHIQYVKYLGQMLQGNFGTSFRFHQPVGDLIVDRFPTTIALAVFAFILTLVLGLAVGTLSAYRRGTRVDRITTTMLSAIQASPSFFVGIILVLVFSVRLGVLPTSGFGTAAQLVLPAITLAAAPVAGIARLTRSSLLEVLKTDYIRTARAKGISGPAIWRRHALKNASLPLVTASGLYFANLLTGAVLVETVFAIPGIGRLSVDAVNTRDFPLIQGTVLFVSLIFVGINFLVDCSYQFLDPRIKS